MHPLARVLNNLRIALAVQPQPPLPLMHRAISQIAKTEDLPVTAAGVRLAKLQKELARICAGEPIDQDLRKRLTGALVGAREFLAGFEAQTRRASDFPEQMTMGLRVLFSGMRERIGPERPDAELVGILREEAEVLASTLKERDSRVFQNDFFQPVRKTHRNLAEDLRISRPLVHYIEQGLRIRALRRIVRNRFLPSDPLDYLIADFELPARPVNRLKESHLYFFRDLSERTEGEVGQVMGPKSRGLKKIKTIMANIGVSFQPADLDSAILDQSVDILPLPTRASTCLERMRVVWIGQLVQLREEDLTQNPNFGRRSLKEIRLCLADHGLSLGMRVDWQPPSAHQHVGT